MKHQSPFYRNLQQKEKQTLQVQPKTLWLCCRYAIGQSELVLVPWLSRLEAEQHVLQLPCGPHALDIFAFEIQVQGRAYED